MTWEKISSKQVYKNKWIEVTEDIVKTDFGKKLTYGVVHKKPCVLIIPWDGKQLTLVGQYRYSVDDFSWEFPQGHGEHNSIEETARNELAEETGLKAVKMKDVASFYLAQGFCSQISHVFLAADLTEGEPDFEEGEEGIIIKKVTFEEFEQMIKHGQIKDGPTLAAFGIINSLNLLKR